MRLMSRRTIARTTHQVFPSKSSQVTTICAVVTCCRCQRLMVTLSILITVSVIISLLTVGRLHHCRTPSTSGRRRYAVAGQRELRSTAGRGNQERQVDDWLDPPLLCIFTTFKPVNFKLQIYENTLRNWVSLTEPNRLRAILYVTPHPRPDGFNGSSKMNVTDGTKTTTDFDLANTTLISLARHLGWFVMNAPRINANGLPYFKEMFADAAKRFANCSFYGYSNGDILFTDGLVRTLDSVEEVLVTLGRSMVIGRRTNSPSSNWSALYRPADVERYAKVNGRLFIANAQDYFFIAGNRFPWHRVPDVVIGRPAYDNFIVATAINDGVAVVDATASLTALHQSDRDGNYAGHSHSDRNANLAAIGRPFVYMRGTTTRSQFITKVSTSTPSPPSSSLTTDIDESGTTIARSTVTIHYRFIRRQVYRSFWSFIGLTC